jgi:hypothetical protein
VCPTLQQALEEAFLAAISASRLLRHRTHPNVVIEMRVGGSDLVLEMPVSAASAWTAP